MMGTPDVRVDTRLNKHLWSKGVRWVTWRIPQKKIKRPLTTVKDGLLFIKIKDGDLISLTIKYTNLEPWPDDTPNSSQVTKSKLALVGGQTVPSSQASLQETIQLCEYNCVVA